MKDIEGDTVISTRKINRRKLLQLGAYSALAGGFSCSPSVSVSETSTRNKKRPNVLLLVLDTARADRFSCYGYDRSTTPYIDSVAAAGAVYEKAYSTTFWTLPTHASIFTGLYPSQAGATTTTNHLPDSNLTIADMLRESGYSTLGFSCNSWVSKERGFGKGFNEFIEMWRPENRKINTGSPKKLELIATDKITSRLRAMDKEEPFFLFANLNTAHMPYRPPRSYLTPFLKDTYDRRDILRVSNITGMWQHLVGKIKLSKRDLEIMNDLYDAEMAVNDYCVEQMIETLKKLDVLDDTLVIIMSDHGENIGDHGMIDHLMSMYDTTTHIPLIIRYPSRFPAGTRNEDLVSQIDIAPTILDVCNIQGGSKRLRPEETSLARKDRRQRTFVFSENERPANGIKIIKNLDPDFDVSGIDCRMRVIRSKQDKMIWSVGVKKELYDTNSDPGELNNTADSNPGRCDELQNVLTVWMEQMSHFGEAPSFTSQDQESLEILRSLGYVE